MYYKKEEKANLNPRVEYTYIPHAFSKIWLIIGLRVFFKSVIDADYSLT
jgi:hypothetical protein